MNDCYFEKKDWRACKKEVRPVKSHVFASNRFHIESNLLSQHALHLPNPGFDDCHVFKRYIS